MIYSLKFWREKKTVCETILVCYFSYKKMQIG